MRANRKQINSLMKMGQNLFDRILDDDEITDKEFVELTVFLQDIKQTILEATAKRNPEQCYMAYTTAKVMVDGLTGNALARQAEKDGFEPAMVLFLAESVEGGI